VRFFNGDDIIPRFQLKFFGIGVSLFCPYNYNCPQFIVSDVCGVTDQKARRALIDASSKFNYIHRFNPLSEDLILSEEA
jgi:hypothetical protein